MIRFRLPDGAVDSFLPEAAEMLRRVCPHEVGHALIARHFGARVYGVALSQIEGGIEAAAIYETATMRLEDWCTVKAAGPAGEVVAFGDYGPAGASRDFGDIQNSGFAGDLDVLISLATSILKAQQQKFEILTRALSNRILKSDEIVVMTPLRLGRVGAYLLGENELS